MSCQRYEGLTKMHDNGYTESFGLCKKTTLVLCMVIITIGNSGHAFAQSSGMILSDPTTVDMNGHQKNDLYTGQPIGFSSIIENHSAGEKRFTYVVLVLDQNNQIQSQSGMSANIVPNQSLTVMESWTPQKSGTYTVQTFLLNGYLISSPLTDVIKTNIVVK